MRQWSAIPDSQLGAGRRSLSFSVETVSLILPHSYDIVLEATARAEGRAQGRKLITCKFSAKTREPGGEGTGETRAGGLWTNEPYYVPSGKLLRSSCRPYHHTGEGRYPLFQRMRLTTWTPACPTETASPRVRPQGVALGSARGRLRAEGPRGDNKQQRLQPEMDFAADPLQIAYCGIFDAIIDCSCGKLKTCPIRGQARDRAHR
jgi:hypothetical protein